MADPEKSPKKPRRRARKPDGDGGDDPRRKPHEEEGDAVRVHEAYLEHRMGGGEEPDPEAHLRAIEQFERLPGALPTTPPKTPDEPGDENDEKGDRPKEGPAE
jgi:hypothetical protein